LCFAAFIFELSSKFHFVVCYLIFCLISGSVIIFQQSAKCNPH